jgi:hypothetical protein
MKGVRGRELHSRNESARERKKSLGLMEETGTTKTSCELVKTF